MSVEEKRKAAEEIGTLGSCLIEGDPEQKARERKIKRRALVSSVVLQSVALMAIVLVPLLGRTEKISIANVIPIPPYSHTARKPDTQVRQSTQRSKQECIVCFNRDVSAHPATQSNLRQVGTQPGDAPDIGIAGNSSDRIPGMEGPDNRRGPTPPDDPDRNRKKRINVGGLVQQAMLIHRVQPVYPPLAWQIRKSGQVHLRAIISVDGSIESLQVMDGDPLLVKSAMDAVGQWRYKPTLLNGQAVEVETIITVIYSLGQQ